MPIARKDKCNSRVVRLFVPYADAQTALRHEHELQLVRVRFPVNDLACLGRVQHDLQVVASRAHGLLSQRVFQHSRFQLLQVDELAKVGQQWNVGLAQILPLAIGQRTPNLVARLDGAHSLCFLLSQRPLKYAAMGKSEWRNLLAEEYYPQAHSKGTPPDIKAQATVVVHDSMQLLKSLQGTKIKTCVGLVQAFRAAAIESLQLGSRVHTFIYSFDKYPFVPVSKGVEQMSRDSRPSVAEDIDSEADEDDDGGPKFRGAKELTIGKKLDENWLAHMFDRHYHVPRYVRFIVTQLLFGPPEVRLHLRPGCKVIFDGHYLEDVDLFDGICAVPDRVIEFPFILQRIPVEIKGAANPNGFEVALREDLENTIGEGDFGMLFLISKLAPDEPVVMYSIDSDLVWICMRFFEKFPNHPGIANFFWPNLSYVVPGTYPDGRPRPAGAPPWQRWWDMKLLRALIVNDKRLRATRNPLRVLELACLASGGDYVPYNEIPPAHWVNAVFRTPEKFSDLCRGNNTISFKPFVDLVRGALSTARRKTMPSMTHMRNCFDNIVHYLDMLSQTARPEGVLYEQNPCFFGYSRIDKTKPLTRDNIKWREDDGTADACRLLPENDRTHYGLWPDYPPRTSALPSARAHKAPVVANGKEVASSDDDDEEEDADYVSAEDSDTVIQDAETDDDDLSDLLGESSEEEEDVDGDSYHGESDIVISGEDDIIIVDTSEEEEEQASALQTAFGAAAAARHRPKPPPERFLAVKLSLDGHTHSGATLQLPDDWPQSAAARKQVASEVKRGIKRHLRDLEKEQQPAPVRKQKNKKKRSRKA